jgi:hypothetical protein
MGPPRLRFVLGIAMTVHHECCATANLLILTGCHPRADEVKVLSGQNSLRDEILRTIVRSICDHLTPDEADAQTIQCRRFSSVEVDKIAAPRCLDLRWLSLGCFLGGQRHRLRIRGWL